MSSDGIGRREFLAAGVAMAALATGARGQGTATDARTVQVLMQDIAFVPSAIEVRVGDTIEWVNKDPFAHTATVDGAWNIELEPGQTGAHVVTKDDTVQYYCTYHPNMIGKITVLS